MSQDTPDIPPAPPEAEVIRLARMTARLTVAEAAAKVRAAGGTISDAYWRDTERGRGGRRGKPVLSRARDGKLAQMAYAVGATPEQLRAAARNHPEGEIRARVVESAARVLEAMLRRAAPPLAAVPAPPVTFERTPADVFPDMSPQMRAAAEAEIPAINALVRSAAIDGPLTGPRIFPGSPHEAERWDRLSELSDPSTGLPFTPWQMIRLMAVGRVRDDERRAGNQPARVRGVLTSV